MKSRVFEKYLKEIEPAWQKYVARLDGRDFDPIAYREFRKEALAVLAKLKNSRE